MGAFFPQGSSYSRNHIKNMCSLIKNILFSRIYLYHEFYVQVEERRKKYYSDVFPKFVSNYCQNCNLKLEITVKLKLCIFLDKIWEINCCPSIIYKKGSFKNVVIHLILSLKRMHSYNCINIFNCCNFGRILQKKVLFFHLNANFGLKLNVILADLQAM